MLTFWIIVALMALLVAATFGIASLPEILAMFPLPPAVDTAVAEQEHHGPSDAFFMQIWGILIVGTLAEVAMAYLQPRMQLTITTMLTLLMLISIFKAGLIVAYFMHLRFERMSLVLTLIPALVMCMCLLAIFFPDGKRMRELGQERHLLDLKPAVAEGSESH